MPRARKTTFTRTVKSASLVEYTKPARKPRPRLTLAERIDAQFLFPCHDRLKRIRRVLARSSEMRALRECLGAISEYQYCRLSRKEAVRGRLFAARDAARKALGMECPTRSTKS